jgi:hypothetical protein
MKQETLEETTRNYSEKEYSTPIPLGICSDFARLGAKWQEERSYSEEDMISFANFKTSNLMKHSDSRGYYLGDKKVFDLWVDQFKKK